ncbi:hypothetical protein KCP76_26345 (plasmid) [Salmonella enterica subsp. enterica serovar Weltevreden]|nr:hypothetical protein KCP76_26345 [Salmonella enterica subsp. enterica serovar Weltevreden]QUI99493.1 hypothetical protein KCP74_25765 [Salmonella enterica subsp. enterica]
MESKRRHLHPVAVYLKGIIRRLPVVSGPFFTSNVQPAPAFTALRLRWSLASSAFRPVVVGTA